MPKLHVLSPGFSAPNSAAFLMPLIKFSKALSGAGIDISIHSELSPSITDCDYLFIDSKYYKHHWTRDFDGTLEEIANLNTKTKLIWCDTGDSTGTFLGQVLPHVHAYLKPQLLRNKAEYLKEHYASRIWGQYYHDKYGIEDKDDYIRQPVKNAEDLNKIHLSWNSGLMNYGYWGPYLQRLRSHLNCDGLLFFSKALKQANALRPMEVTCRMGIPYPRATMRYQREQVRERLKAYLPTDKLSRRDYFKELCLSKVCVSPFGLGEITLKDFECFLTGSLLLKPDMAHMETWPNFYQDKKTCLFHDWDLNTLQEKIDWALAHERESIEIAQYAQDLYLSYTASKEAESRFTEYVLKLLHDMG